MTNEDVILSKAAHTSKNVEADVKVDYFDEDVILIDNVKLLVDPGTAVTRLNMNMLVFCISGKALGTINGSDISIRENQLLLCPPGVSITNFMLSPNFDFKALFISNRLLQSFLREKMAIWNDILYIHKTNIVNLNNEAQQFVSHFLTMLKLCIGKGEMDSFKNEVVQSLLHCGILGLCSVLRTMIPNAPISSSTRTDSLFQQFLNLLNNSRVKHRPVESYASELCITPKYLSAICKKNSGKTANTWITEHVLEDIRYYLKSTDYSIKEISSMLGFPNPSFFGKYVKDHFGTTPSKLRQI